MGKTENHGWRCAICRSETPCSCVVKPCEKCGNLRTFVFTNKDGSTENIDECPHCLHKVGMEI